MDRVEIFNTYQDRIFDTACLLIGTIRKNINEKVKKGNKESLLTVQAMDLQQVVNLCPGKAGDANHLLDISPCLDDEGFQIAVLSNQTAG